MAGNLIWQKNVKGASSPWLVASENHLNDQDQPRLFLLKNFRQGEDRARIVEYVCTSIARELDIGAPRVELLQITDSFLESLRGFSPSASDVDLARTGLHLAVAWHENAIEVAEHPGVFSRLAVPTQVAGIIGSDTLLQNMDRHASNLLIRPHMDRSRVRNMLVPIDWGDCFNALLPEPQNLADISYRSGIYANSFMIERIQSRADFRPFVERLSRWSGQPEKISAIIGGIPAEWQCPERWRRGLLDHITRRVDVVLELLSNADRLAALFPNWQYSH
jgi:hypothetical protein